MSSLTEGRGLKCSMAEQYGLTDEVVPHGGTWVEISAATCNPLLFDVVPHGGTWVEIVLRA